MPMLNLGVIPVLLLKKTGSLVNSGDNLGRRMDKLENKLEAILNSIKK